MSNGENKMTSGGRIVFGLIFILFGIFPMLAAFDIGPLGVRDINGPPWIGFVAGGTFVVAGIAIMSPNTLISKIMGFLILVGLAAISNWIAFGVGERVCSSNIDLFGFMDSSEHSDLACRIPFGLGAVMMNAIFLHISVSSIQKMQGGPPTLQRTRKVTEWGMWLSISPILLPLILFLILSSAFEALKTKIQTGDWPRNTKFIDRQKRKGFLKPCLEEKVEQSKHPKS